MLGTFALEVDDNTSQIVGGCQVPRGSPHLVTALLSAFRLPPALQMWTYGTSGEHTCCTWKLRYREGKGPFFTLLCCCWDWPCSWCNARNWNARLMLINLQQAVLCEWLLRHLGHGCPKPGVLPTEVYCGWRFLQNPFLPTWDCPPGLTCSLPLACLMAGVWQLC